MSQAKVAHVEGEPPKTAARSTVAVRLMRAMYPTGTDSSYLRWFGLALLALAAIFPWLGGPFYTRLAIETFLLGAVALSVDILLGYAGLLSLGQAETCVAGSRGGAERMHLGEQQGVAPLHVAFRHKALDFRRRPDMFAEKNESERAIQPHVDVRHPLADLKYPSPVLGGRR